jgi:hypothetical protein
VPIHYQRDDEKKRVLVRAEGNTSLDEALAIMDRQAADGAWAYAVQYDLRGATRVPTPEDVHQMVMHIGRLTAKHGPRGSVALIVGDPGLFKAAKRYASLGELTALNAELFPTTEAAESWLDSLTPQ